MRRAATRSVAYHLRRALLRCCRSGDRSSSARHGRQLHALLLRNGHLPDVDAASSSTLSGALFHMYAAGGSPVAALGALRAVPLSRRTAVDWTALLSCHSRNGLHADVLRLFRVMEVGDGVVGDEVTVVCVLGACARLRDSAAGAALHPRIVKRGLFFHVPVRNALMDLYAKCGAMEHARKLFEEMGSPSVVSWTVILSGALRWEGLDSARRTFLLMGDRKNEFAWTIMVSGCVQSGLPREALALISQMLLRRRSDRTVRLNHVTLCSVLSACSQAGDLTVGRWAHAYTTKMAGEETAGDETHRVMVATALIDMYAKCGRIDTARSLFETLPRRNIVTWNAMLGGLAMHGLAEESLLLFSRMVEEEGIPPDEITFVGVLSACSRCGLVEEGRRQFHRLKCVYGLTPQVEHYACLVDLLGRAGHLEEAAAVVRSMPVSPNEVVLGSLLASCGIHGEVELGRQVMEELDSLGAGQYDALVSNMYASSGNQADADALRGRRGVHKSPGVSYIAVGGCVHRFRAGEKSHPRTAEIYTALEEMRVRLSSAAGYAGDGRIWRVMEGYLGEAEEREEALLWHSERLAIAFGMISTRPGSPLLVFKNIRICGDCHRAAKLISQVYGREITVRDRNRFHLFKQGACSCNDYW